MQLKSGGNLHKVHAMKVSVLIPTYNSGRFLEECLESVLVQDFTDMEILIADDGSTDTTIKTIETFAARDSRIRWWQNSKNVGGVENHNLLLREARGEYIKFVHHDDKLISKSAISKLAAVLDANAAVSLVSSACELIDSNSQITGRRDYFSAGIWDGRSVIKSCFEFEPAANYIGDQVSVIYRRFQIIDRGFRKDFLQSSEAAMWFFLLEKGGFAYLPEPLSAYRNHGTQVGAVIGGRDQNQIELLMLLESYWAKPWFGGPATQRMLNSSIRFLKKRRAKFGLWTERADALRQQMQARTNFLSMAFYWLMHKMLRSFKIFHDFAVRNTLRKV
jgi:glycosyltransferase involved in cell wall biosynthesis